MMTRSERWFYILYDPSIRMTQEEYLYILALCLASTLAVGLGLVLGWLWVLAL
jgi:hypothetical protein